MSCSYYKNLGGKISVKLDFDFVTNRKIVYSCDSGMHQDAFQSFEVDEIGHKVEVGFVRRTSEMISYIGSRNRGGWIRRLVVTSDDEVLQLLEDPWDKDFHDIES